MIHIFAAHCAAGSLPCAARRIRKGWSLLEETTPCATPRETRGAGPSTPGLRSSSHPSARAWECVRRGGAALLLRLSIWRAPLSASPLLRWGFGALLLFCVTARQFVKGKVVEVGKPNENCHSRFAFSVFISLISPDSHANRFGDVRLLQTALCSQLYNIFRKRHNLSIRPLYLLTRSFIRAIFL